MSEQIIVHSYEYGFTLYKINMDQDFDSMVAELDVDDATLEILLAKRLGIDFEPERGETLSFGDNLYECKGVVTLKEISQIHQELNN